VRDCSMESLVKNLLFSALVFILASCSSFNNSRNLSSTGGALDGTYLGAGKYKFGRKGPNRPAVRLYLHEIEGEKGSYHAVLLEYVNLLKMAPKYVASNKLPKLSNKIGYLNQITRKIAIYKVVPTQDPLTFEMQSLKVSGDDIVVEVSDKPRLLILSESQDQEHPLVGAKITQSTSSQAKEIYFPGDKDKQDHGVQYSLAKFTYEKVKLDSTWRKSYLPGPYLSQYGRKTDVVLELNQSGNVGMADFKINPAMANMPAEKRRKMFTNPKSAFINGQYQAIEPRDGMFLFVKENRSERSDRNVKGRVGLFIDIFDASKSLNQDVVELVLIDPENPEDFHMYYEHPDNGDGQSN
jgi:hypothetical protein